MLLLLLWLSTYSIEKLVIKVVCVCRVIASVPRKLILRVIRIDSIRIEVSIIFVLRSC